MLLKKRYGRPLSALSLSLALAFAPLFNVQAAEPEVVPGDSSATPGELSVALTQSDGQSPAVAKLAGEQPLSMEAAANSRAQIEALLPAGYKPVFINPLVSLYAARDMKPMWENRAAVQAFQQQRFSAAVYHLGQPADRSRRQRHGARCGVVGCHDGLSALYQRHPHPGDPLAI